MPRDLFEEAGIAPDTASGGRDLFAEAGVAPPAAPQHGGMNALAAAAINRALLGLPDAGTDPFEAEKRVARGVGRGMLDLPDAGAQLLAHGLEAVAPAGSALEASARTARQNVDRNLTAENQSYQRLRAAMGGTGFDAGRLVGNGLAALPLTAALPAATGPLVGALGGAAGGAASGALQPVYGLDETGAGFGAAKGQQVALGGAGGGLVGAAAGGLSRLISPRASTNPQVQQLRDAGADLTVGQTLGGAAKKAEDAMTSVPLGGGKVTAAQARGVETANRGAINEALAPIGETLGDSTKAGYDAIAEAGNKISAAYKDVLPRVSAQLDAPFAADLQKAFATAFEAPQAQIDQFNNLLGQKLANQVDGFGQMTGKGWKQAQSELGRLGTQYLGSTDADQKTLGRALMQARDAVTEMMARQNPAEAPVIRAADEAFKRFLPIEQAAQSKGAVEGVFTGAQLRGAVHDLDGSLRNGAFARGRAPMQGYADAMKAVTGQRLADSGTATRALMSTGVPGLLSAIGLGAPLQLGYAPVVQRALTAAAASRPAVAAPIGQALSRINLLSAPLAPRLTPPSLLGQLAGPPAQ